MMTEEDARQKWCPFSMNSGTTGDGESGSWNRTMVHGNPHQTCRCIGSMCMAWRQSSNVDRGYCGLAGQPTIVE